MFVLLSLLFHFQHHTVKFFVPTFLFEELNFLHAFHDARCKRCLSPGADPGFSFGGGGGGRKKLYARTHITSAKSEVPFGRDPGPPGSSRVF